MVGKLLSPYGIKGWLKVRSFTQNEEDLFRYQPWLMKGIGPNANWREIKFDNFRKHGKGFVVHLENCDDRDQAELLRGIEIYVARDVLPAVAPEEVYWADLEGLQVVNMENEILGNIASVMETGANDVLVVKPSDSSIDQQERLIPYVDHVICELKLQNDLVIVDWRSDF